jgi:hypothetical protein
MFGLLVMFGQLWSAPLAQTSEGVGVTEAIAPPSGRDIVKHLHGANKTKKCTRVPTIAREHRFSLAHVSVERRRKCACACAMGRSR